MTRCILIFLSIMIIEKTWAAEIKGTVKDNQGEPLPGVNVYLKDTYDGATTNLEGQFVFETTEQGSHTLMASFVGFTNFETIVQLDKNIQVDIRLDEEVNRLSGVTITAGSFEASDEKKSVVLKPLDIAMTAGALADVPAALNSLPGTTKNGETGRLFVRGGTANETQAFIDGVKVQNFYTASPNNIPSRSRFSPFLFKGTFFSTGGYSAEYGQALSSILSLNSQDMPDQSQTDLSFMTVGGGVAHTQKWNNGSIHGALNYTNLDPYNGLISQKVDWQDGYTSYDGTVMLRQKTNDSDMVKLYANYNQSGFRAIMPSVNNANGDLTDLTNKNVYVNTSYKKAVGENSSLYFGGSIGNSTDDIQLNKMIIDDNKLGYHGKSYFNTDIAHISLKVGAEVIHTEETQNVTMEDNSKVLSQFGNNQMASFAEADYFITNSLTIRAGLRYSHYSIFNESVISPRLSMALKTGENSQLSWAYGKFHQLPENELLLRSKQMSYEKADHYMMSYQTIQSGRTFRGEVYYKVYDDLVKFDPLDQYNPYSYNNSGNGYARGLDLFFRDSKTIENADFWISYSFIDTKRDYKNYPYEVNPEFAAKHNLSIVYKHFVSVLKTQFGATYSFNSGRPYNNPNEKEFNNGLTKAYSDLSFNFAYLHRSNVIFYASATNLLGRKQVFGYEYAKNPQTDGTFKSMAIEQPAKRFFFVGIFITLTKNKQINQLENL